MELERALKISTNLIVDITMSVTVLKDYLYKSDLSKLHERALYRLCFTSIIMNCSKYVEFCDKYNKLLHTENPKLDSLRNTFKEKVKNKGIISFRNDYIGHIHSKKLQRPLDDIEIQDKFISIIDSDNVALFFDWLCPEDILNTDLTKSLVGVIQLTRDELEKSYNRVARGL
ncbi:hypothetical protein [Pseudoalteromonas distincta]|uniref:hypothetical protein n=1 Tax=Pseudoalteromonas distincta TaxID=77608 RepID=UPI0032E1E0F8